MLLMLAMITAESAHSQNRKARHILQLLDSVQTTFQSQNSYKKDAWWDKAMYHTANMEAYRLTGCDRYLRYSEKWAIHNKWMGAREANKANWKYQRPMYEHDNVMFADWQVCFQTYIDLYNISPDPIKTARAIEVMEYQTARQESDFWYWADALYMAMPLMTRLYNLTGQRKYLDKMYEWHQFTSIVMYDRETGLYFRDRNYVYPRFKSKNGKKEFWSRGNGWVMAALARVLDQMPKDYKHYGYFKERYIKMAYAVRERQQEGGYWTQNIDDPDEMPGYETSGTALFTYAMAWGINNGILSKKDFGPVLRNAWHYLENTALLPNHHIGYIQDWGEKAEPGFPISEKNQTIFGTGCWILAAVEYCKYQDRKTYSTSTKPAQ